MYLKKTHLNLAAKYRISNKTILPLVCQNTPLCFNIFVNYYIATKS